MLGVISTGGCPKSSSAMLSMWLALTQNFTHPRLVICFFPTSPIKLELGLKNVGDHEYRPTWTNQNHLGNQKQVLIFAVPFASLRMLYSNAGPNHLA